MGSLCYLFTISVTEGGGEGEREREGGCVCVFSGFWFANFKERNHLEDVDVVGKVILKWTTCNCGWVRTRLKWLRTGSVVRRF